jgi:hypothetical protein
VTRDRDRHFQQVAEWIASAKYNPSPPYVVLFSLLVRVGNIFVCRSRACANGSGTRHHTDCSGHFAIGAANQF